MTDAAAIAERAASRRKPPVRSGPGASAVLAIVPAYNEERSVGDVVRGLRDNGYEALVIDDGSTDGTAAAAASAGAAVVRLPYNLGIGGAVQTGFLYARDHGYRYAVQVDGDGQHDPAELAKLMDAMRRDGSLDVVCGSRFLTDEHGYRAPRARRLGIRLFAFALTRAVGQRVTDPTSGFRLCSRRAIELFARDYPHDYPEVEALLMLHANRLRFAEISVRMHARSGGRSSINARRSAYYMVKVSLALLAGIMRRRPEQHPLGEVASA